ncbi:MAG: hypothetical protein EKK63_01755 [Acinetobacter sp.]|uniref:hypothetical protein n=1 Tax=Acinetobacter sp. TaxID=472 RepID=UPI000FBF5831|nr:hypothetical protein [Acinetobacter sp.]RUP42330.1 MAG: hypothetical protein EKK63_01755 [Acinetobacter sp.]
MIKYKFKVEYTFTGYVEVNAESPERAKEIVDKDFGMVAGNIHTSNESTSATDAGVVDWLFDAHASNKTIEDVTR